MTAQPDNASTTEPGTALATTPTDEGQPYPTFSEQVAAQLGGVRGMIESSVPVIAFVVANTFWALRPALVIAVATALLIAAYRFTRRHTIRHAINGLFGIALGALIAWRTGSPKDFYVPGIVLSLGYAVAMVISVGARRPLVGWIWSVVADNGRTRWRDDAPLRRVFGWLTVLWAGIYFAKVVVQSGVYFTDSLTEDQKGTVLGLTRILLGFPPYALLLAITVWAVRRHLRSHAPTAPA